MTHESTQHTDSAVDPAARMRNTPVKGEKPSWIFKGFGSVLRFQPLLALLAERGGLSGEADSLEYFLSSHDSLKKQPYLVLFGSAGASAWNENTGAGLEAAVLLFEYNTRLRGTRVLSTADSTGRRNVLAPPEQRARVAALATRRLMSEGAQVVRIAFSETHRGSSEDAGMDVLPPHAAMAAIAEEMGPAEGHRQHGKWTLNEEHMQLYLPLLDSFDTTLARIGQRTRSNLRYYRRRCENEHGSRYVAKVSVSLAEFLAFNAECTYGVDAELARWRYNTLSLPQCRLCGVQALDGRWLSMAGLRENGRYIELDWQMNRAGMNAASLATVLRACLIQDEIARGSTRLYIEGGTPQPIRHSFAGERVLELIVKRRSLYVSALERSASRVFPVQNRLAQCLGDDRLDWRVW